MVYICTKFGVNSSSLSKCGNKDIQTQTHIHTQKNAHTMAWLSPACYQCITMAQAVGNNSYCHRKCHCCTLVAITNSVLQFNLANVRRKSVSYQVMLQLENKAVNTIHFPGGTAVIAHTMAMVQAQLRLTAVPCQTLSVPVEF